MELKFLRVGTAHSKNIRGFELLAKEVNATLEVADHIENINANAYDLVWIPQGFYHSLQLPNVKHILYGPHNFLFPNEPWIYKIEPVFDRSIYTSLSLWVQNLYSSVGTICMPVKPLAFPVDIEKFKPNNSEKTYDCFVYFKSRSKQHLQYIENILVSLNYNYKVLTYGNYKEEEYIDILNKSTFGIWLGAHESQGFALEECLSMNVPLIVCNVKSLNDEINGEGNHSYMEYKDKYNMNATSCPYFDERCGSILYDLNDLPNNVEMMKHNYMSYQPRNYILENLSPKVCYERIIRSFNEL
uniref:Glycosyl transferase family 1 domain-containing protein n=1 Tax=viral metagenome TaxID=1070528 RepID=A0A6C0D6R3_9ZZZZ